MNILLFCILSIQGSCVIGSLFTPFKGGRGGWFKLVDFALSRFLKGRNTIACIQSPHGQPRSRPKPTVFSSKILLSGFSLAPTNRLLKTPFLDLPVCDQSVQCGALQSITLQCIAE